MWHTQRATPCSQWCADVVLFRVLCVVRTLLQIRWWLHCALLFAQLFASRASNCCKHDMGAFLWLKSINTRKRAHPPLWQTGKVLRQWVLFCETKVHACKLPTPAGPSLQRNLPFSALVLWFLGCLVCHNVSLSPETRSRYTDTTNHMYLPTDCSYRIIPVYRYVMVDLLSFLFGVYSYTLFYAQLVLYF